MDDSVREALHKDTRIEITTTGRKSGEARRIPTGIHNVDGRLFIAGPPGRRSWYANLLSHAELTVHLTQSVGQDVATRASAITDAAGRRQVFTRMQELEERMKERNMEEWIEGSALVEIQPTE